MASVTTLFASFHNIYEILRVNVHCQKQKFETKLFPYYITVPNFHHSTFTDINDNFLLFSFSEQMLTWFFLVQRLISINRIIPNFFDRRCKSTMEHVKNYSNWRQYFRIIENHRWVVLFSYYVFVFPRRYFDPLKIPASVLRPNLNRNSIVGDVHVLAV